MSGPLSPLSGANSLHARAWQVQEQLKDHQRAINTRIRLKAQHYMCQKKQRELILALRARAFFNG